ncbi:cytochrome P450 family protein [Rhizoctonia solani AG-3 Rhs1AP]|uniref:Cytochrome P450 family protein n=2 Tax=Rhizoctonia solani AG-3 TaxID=1086053 RepID=A0A074RXD9_9AGAM|nr:cytochrome P450 family protein [Rhizoctonia solani AG-3 Rhs1AP]KEP49268.1 cytochrome P450 family protein [Rhizoctonia solani 123E]
MQTETSVSLSTALVATGTLIGAWALVDTLKKRHQLPFPPGPPEKSWIGGNALDMPRSHLWLRFTEWAKQYGDIVHVRVHTNHIVLLSSYDVVTDLFDKRGSTYSHRSERTMTTMMGWKHFMSSEAYGDRWRAYRRQANSGFNKKAVVKYQDGQARDVHVFLQRLLSDSENFISQIKWLAGSIIMRTTYGYKVLETNDPHITIADDALASLQFTGVAGNYLVDSYPFLRYLPAWLPGMEFKRQAEEWSKYPARMAQEPFDWTKEQMKNGLAVPSFLSGLLEQNKDGLDGEDVIKWTSASMYSAGAHTTVGTISNFILAMVLYPEVFRKAQEEIDRVVGSERLPLVSDRVDLPYIECVLSETLRWYPVAPLAIPHRVLQDDEYRGYRIPAGSTVISNVYAITRDERIYPDPETFIPERFDTSRPGPNPPNPRDFIFGIGRRVCPGNHIADVSVWLAIASLAATMDINKTRDSNGVYVEPVTEWSSGFVSQLRPFKCSIKPRSEKVAKLINSAVMFEHE